MGGGGAWGGSPQIHMGDTRNRHGEDCGRGGEAGDVARVQPGRWLGNPRVAQRLSEGEAAKQDHYTVHMIDCLMYNT